MRPVWKEILRLKAPIMFLTLGAVVWGIEVSFKTASLLLFFLGLSVILGHWFGKELFRSYGWDVGAKLNKAWLNRDPACAILAVGMLIARVIIYAVVVIAMAVLTSFLLRGTAFGAAPSVVPKKAVPFLSVLTEEANRIWPEANKCIFAGQIQAESAWKETAKRIEPSGSTSYGLMQVLDSTFLEMRRKHKTLADVEPVQMLQARYSIRAGIIYDKFLYTQMKCRDSEEMRWHYLLRAFNGGTLNLNREITRAGTCDPEKVAQECRRRVIKLKNGTLDLCKVNISYPRRVFKFAENYKGVFFND